MGGANGAMEHVGRWVAVIQGASDGSVKRAAGDVTGATLWASWLVRADNGAGGDTLASAQARVSAGGRSIGITGLDHSIPICGGSWSQGTRLGPGEIASSIGSGERIRIGSRIAVLLGEGCGGEQ